MSIVKALQSRIVTSKSFASIRVDPIIAVTVTVKIPASLESLVVAILTVFIEASKVIRLETGKLVIA